MISKLIAYYLRLRYWRQRRKGFGLLHEVGSRVTFKRIGDRQIMQPTKPLPQHRAYNTSTKQWEDMDV